VLNDPRFATPEARFHHTVDVDDVIGPWMLTQNKRTAMELLNGAGVPAGAVYDTGDLMDDPSLRATGMLSEVTHPQRGRVVIPGWPVKMSGSEPIPVKCPPLLGEHTSAALHDILGLSEDEIDRLRADGAV
jgi:formyl-CoA transferase